jgi:hypothetical protein
MDGKKSPHPPKGGFKSPLGDLGVIKKLKVKSYKK